MDHLLVHTAATRIALVRAHVKILIRELTPDADHFDPFGFVSLDQKLVFHSTFVLLNVKGALDHYQQMGKWLQTPIEYYKQCSFGCREITATLQNNKLHNQRREPNSAIWEKSVSIPDSYAR